MRKAVAVSAIMHLALVTLAYFGVPVAHKDLVVGSESVPIEVVSVAERTNLPPPRPPAQAEKPVAAARTEAKPTIEPQPKVMPKPQPPATSQPDSAKAEPPAKPDPPAQASTLAAKPRPVSEAKPQQPVKAEAQPSTPAPPPAVASPQPDEALSEQPPTPQPTPAQKPAPQRKKPLQDQATPAAVAEDKPAPRQPETKAASDADFQTVLKTVGSLARSEPQKPASREPVPNKAAEAVAREEEPQAKDASSSKDEFASLIEKAIGSNAGPAAAASSGRTYDPTQPMTISEIDEVRRQIEKCWNVPAGARDAGDHAVTIRVEMSPDATPRSATVLNEAAMRGNAFQRAAAESALRAVLNPRCHPFKLPADKYQHWKTMTLVFNPKDMLGT